MSRTVLALLLIAGLLLLPACSSTSSSRPPSSGAAEAITEQEEDAIEVSEEGGWPQDSGFGGSSMDDYCIAAAGEAIDEANAAGDYSLEGQNSRMPQECVDAGY